MFVRTGKEFLSYTLMSSADLWDSLDLFEIVTLHVLFLKVFLSGPRVLHFST